MKAQTADSISISNEDSVVKYKLVVVHDTVYVPMPEAKMPVDSSRIIYAKPVGRYDRGIMNYRFIPKHKWIGGVTVSVFNFESDNSRLLFSLLKDIDLNLRTLSVKPFVGYAIKDNTVVGLKLGYSRISGGINNLALNIEDLDISLKDIKYTDDSYSFSLFHRSYIGLDPKGLFGLFNETTIGYSMGSTRFSRGSGESLKYTDTSINQLNVGLNPGIAIFIMPNVGAEVSFGVAGFTYNWEKQKKSSGEVGKRTNSGANFKINLLNINIGITVCI
ncbi:hypothetical protein [Bacteroides mediterraneensis]|uniref:hypothetical protein n=1 Tax=Bacteroides mediterraneensis TaxID=1841856 RepID=UPI0026F0BAE8|nr:hypothetical protein [Bacteroides mediterraneensis]